MSRHLKNFSLDNIDDLQEYLKDYAKELDAKGLELCKRLADIGVKVAQSNSGVWQGNILFYKDVDTLSNKVILVGIDKGKVLKVWYTDKKLTKQHSYEVSPLLLAEFGSGWYADNKWGIEGVGQGTMPNSYGHAFDSCGWWWYDQSGVKHHSKGERPSYPMYAATIGMILEIDRIANEVFG